MQIQEIETKNTFKGVDSEQYKEKLIRQNWEKLPAWIQEALVLAGFRR